MLTLISRQIHHFLLLISTRGRFRDPHFSTFLLWLPCSLSPFLYLLHPPSSLVFQHDTKASPLGITLLTMACSPRCTSLHLFIFWSGFFPHHLGPSHSPNIFICLLLLPHIMQSSLLATHHSRAVRCFFASTCLVHERPRFFSLWFELLHNHAIPPPDNGSWTHVVKLHKPRLSC